MSNKFRSVLVVSIFMVVAVLLSSCTQSLSSAPAETPTLIPTGLFVSPIASVENPMLMIEQFAKQTEAAQTAQAGGGTPGTPGTPQSGATPTPTSGTPGAVIPSATPTTGAATPTNAASTPVSVATAAPASTSAPTGPRPATYTLQLGEFPYCIARRFNVDPIALLQASGLTEAQANNLAAGTVLTIPQSGTFPGNRALRAHPASYTVASGDETVYSIACLYGDVDPNSIASTNGITANAKLTLGQVLQIP